MSCKPFEASDEGLCKHVKENVQMHGSCDKQVNKPIYTFLAMAMTSVQTSNGPAKSTPVRLIAGSCLTLLTGSGGSGGIGNGCPSNLDKSHING